MNKHNLDDFQKKEPNRFLIIVGVLWVIWLITIIFGIYMEK
jgi:hypothetical protein